MAHDAPGLIRPATSDEMPTVGTLFQEYADALGYDLSFQGLPAEIAGLPGAYAPPGGTLLLSVSSTGFALGCVGVRPLHEAGTCEMKRLYLRPIARGTGLGRALALAAITAAVQAGHECMLLDTLPTMTAAQSLYRELGFETTPAYYDTPISGTIFMRKLLRSV
jgi:ribosomal protein S18 acetylase RimI-like enzyme